MVIVWHRFVNSLVFYGLSLSSTTIGGNDYINFFVSGAVEIPANLACLLILERFGRVRPLVASMSFAGTRTDLGHLCSSRSGWLLMYYSVL